MYRVVLTLALFLFPFHTLSNDKLIHATQATWPPYVFGNANSGLAIDIVSAAYRSQGYSLELEIKPWLRSLKEVKHLQKDAMVSVWWSNNRTDSLAFSVPYLMVHLKFIVLRDNKFEYRDFESLKGMTVGVIEEYGYGKDFNNSKYFSREVGSDLATNIRKLRAKRIDAIIADERAAIHTIHKLGLDPDLFYFVDRSLMIKPVYLAVAKDHPNKHTLLVQFMIGLHHIKKSGEYDQLLEQYK
ncbi:transporter substrate-binding domain-containing protein [Vibrio makurazakiensis]|uniref:transporter substrate-binding domain-containing protein n=1 Tax=Vibrio makurazakiensis TaxID=2910250 RepID=UPI003D0A5822